eukprot:scaffold8577_cov61-Phaeocystis_antarctica.AAC.4
MPTRSRQNSGPPRLYSQELTPRWPPPLPPHLSLMRPTARSRSSCTTRMREIGSACRRAIAAAARPERFIGVIGCATTTVAAPNVPAATHAPSLLRQLENAGLTARIDSSSMAPTLCRVRSYRLPGLPRPRMRRDGGGACSPSCAAEGSFRLRAGGMDDHTYMAVFAE